MLIYNIASIFNKFRIYYYNIIHLFLQQYVQVIFHSEYKYSSFSWLIFLYGAGLLANLFFQHESYFGENRCKVCTMLKGHTY